MPTTVQKVRCRFVNKEKNIIMETQKDEAKPGRALVAVGDGSVEVHEIHVGSPSEWDIKLIVERSAISAGTESHIVRNIARIDSPTVIGYAPVARVDEVGEKAAKYFARGDRVTYFSPNQSLDGTAHVCGGHQSPALLNVNPETRDLLGPDQFCVKIPEGLSSEVAAFGGIAAVSSMGATMPGTKPGDKVLVLGQGLIGQFATQHFRLRGAEVIVSDIDARRLKVATSCGAEYTINAIKEDTVDAVRAIWSDGADIVADTTGSYRIIEETLDALKTRGSYVFLGWCKGSDFTLERFHGQKVFQAFFPWTLEGPHVLHSLRMMKQGGIRVDPLISHRIGIEEAPNVYETILNSPEEHLGIVINWNESTRGDNA
jgi:threonine dehydrogenase-like Zn-dependent dehydrogenase